MKTITTTVTIVLASIFMTACAKKEESAAPAEPAPAAMAAPAPAEAAPAATPDAAANTEDGSQTSGDKVAPKP